MPIQAELTPLPLCAGRSGRATLTLLNPGPGSTTVTLSTACAPNTLTLTFPKGPRLTLRAGRLVRRTVYVTVHPDLTSETPLDLPFTLHISTLPSTPSAGTLPPAPAPDTASPAPLADAPLTLHGIYTFLPPPPAAARLVPARDSARFAGHYRLHLRSQRPYPVDLAFSAEDATAALTITIEPDHFTLAPRTDAEMRITVKPAAPLPRGQLRKAYAFTVKLAYVDTRTSGAPPTELAGTFVHTHSATLATLEHFAARMNWRGLTGCLPLGTCVCAASLAVLVLANPPPSFTLPLPAPTGPGPTSTQPQPTATPQTDCDKDTPPPLPPKADASIPGDDLTPDPGTDQTSGASVSAGFLELPFPYDGSYDKFGGTDAQFAQASLRSLFGGRITSFFDHFYPLYPYGFPGNSPRERPEASTQILTFSGILSPNGNPFYSGHPGYDYTVFPQGVPTPVFAAADGIVVYVGRFSDGGLYVKLKHHVDGVGDFQTMYLHLRSDDYFDDMLTLAPGTPILAGTRIGTMGNTGHSTGPHLHFEVWFDLNQDGAFTFDERVDPYGFQPSAAFPVDPWSIASYHTNLALPDSYLWKHVPSRVVSISADGVRFEETQTPANTGGTGAEDDSNGLCMPANSAPENSTVEYSPWPPPVSPGGPGGPPLGIGCQVTVRDPANNFVTEFQYAVQVTLSYTEADTRNFDEATLAIHFSTDGNAWSALPTEHLPGRRLRAELTQAGFCMVRGAPLRDITPPFSTITLDGETTDGQHFTGPVTVYIQATDPYSGTGVAALRYSLDHGNTWATQTGASTTLTIDPPAHSASTDTHTPDAENESFGGGAGEFALIVSALDLQNNEEAPPAAVRFFILPTDSTATPASTLSPTVTQRASTSPSPAASGTPVAPPTLTATRTRTNTPAASGTPLAPPTHTATRTPSTPTPTRLPATPLPSTPTPAPVTPTRTPPPATPRPSTNTPQPTTLAPTPPPATPRPSTNTPRPTSTPAPTDTPEPPFTYTPEPTSTPAPTDTPEPPFTYTPEPTSTPALTDTPEPPPTYTPKP